MKNFKFYASTWKYFYFLIATTGRFRCIWLLILGVGFCLAGFGQDEILLYENDFETYYEEPLRSGCYLDLDQSSVNDLYFETGNGTGGKVTFGQTYTVETILINGDDDLYTDQTGQGGNYCIGMLRGVSNDDMLSLTLDSKEFNFINVEFIFSAISLQGCFGVPRLEVPEMEIKIYDTPSGNIDLYSQSSYTELGKSSVTGIIPSNDIYTFNWQKVSTSIEIDQSINGIITIVLDLKESEYAAFDNLRITTFENISEICDTTEINLDNGLAAHYPFEGTANDVSENTNNGEILGTTLTTDRFGNQGNAFHFDGNSHISIDDDPSLRPQDFTISLWCRFDDLSGNLQLLIDKHLGTDYLDSYEIWFENNAIKAILSGENDFGSELSKDLMPDTNKWYHIAYSFSDENDIANLYLNGEVVDSKIETPTITYDSEPLLIGASNDSQTPQAFFKGDIDAVRIYNRVLSSCEIEALFDLPYKQYSCPRDDSPINLNQNLVGYYPFNGNSNDESQNNNNGDTVNVELTTDRFGNENAAYLFNGDSYIAINNSSELEDLTREFTISIWFQTDSFYRSDTDWAVIFDKNRQLSFFYDSIGRIFFNENIIANKILQTKIWYNVTLVYKTSELTFYLNNEAISTTNIGEISINTDSLNIGMDNPVLVEYYIGKIDDILIYDRALNECEIEAILDGEKPISFIEPENNEITCSDGIDNDDDGLIDCEEPECADILPGYNKNQCVPCLLDPTSFADSVSIFETSCTFSQQWDEILGPPDAGEGSVPDMLSLGGEGRVVVLFVDNLLVNSGTTAPDIYVFESGGQIEIFEVALRPLNDATIDRLEQLSIQPNENGFYSIGEIAGQPSSVDIDSLFPGYSYCELKFDAVEIIDVISPNPDWDDCDENYDGPDIDAVCALSSIIPIQGCTNPTACNYNPEANIDDNSCILPTVNDTIKPNITCPFDIIVDAEDGECSAIVDYPISATDNCGQDVVPMQLEGFDLLGVFEGHTYFISQSTYQTPDATNEIAISTGGHLLTLASAEEENFIRVNNSSPIWLGFTDRAVEMEWEWVTGELDDYKNWASGEPNNTDGEDWALMNWRGNFSWNDEDYISGGAFIVVEFDGAFLDVQLIEGLASGEEFSVGTTTVTYVSSDFNNNTDTCSFTVTVNGNCVTGCTDETACNYNSNATLDDGSCYDELECYLNCDTTLIRNKLPGTLCEGNNPNAIISFLNAACECEDFDIYINCIVEPLNEDVIIGEEYCFLITVIDLLTTDSLANIPVNFAVSGANESLYDIDFTDENGQVRLCYTPTFAGVDTITITSGNYSFTFGNIIWDFRGENGSLSFGSDLNLNWLLGFGHFYDGEFSSYPPDLTIGESLCTTVTIMDEDSINVLSGIQVSIISTIDGYPQVLVDTLITTNLYGQIEFCPSSPYIGIEECILTTPFSSDTIRYTWMQEPTCDDGIQNGNETEVDCGGNCPECPCENDSGLMQTSNSFVCDGAVVYVREAFSTINENSVRVYVLHEEEEFDGINYISINEQGRFTSPGPDYTNRPLYISAVMGPPGENDLPILEDECTEWTPYGAEYTFFDPVTFNIVDERCEDGQFYIDISLSGGVGSISPNLAYRSVFDGITLYGRLSVGDVVTFGPYQGAGEYYITAFGAKGCPGELVGEYECDGLNRNAKINQIGSAIFSISYSNADYIIEAARVFNANGQQVPANIQIDYNSCEVELLNQQRGMYFVQLLITDSNSNKTFMLPQKLYKN